MKGIQLFLCIWFSLMIPSTYAAVPYKPVGGISGNLSSVGSDTLANMMTLWVEEFRRIYLGVKVEVQAAGSSTAPPALTEGASDLGPMSRMMKDKEIAAFEKKFGYKPTAVPVAIDALAVYVHKDNPIKGLSLPQVDAIFSRNRQCGMSSNAVKWGDLGLTGDWSDMKIQLYGRNSASGTYGYFKKVALCKGDYKSTVNEQPGSASVVQSVSNSLNGIGYSGVGYRTSEVRLVPLSKEAQGQFIEPTPANAVAKKYPLSRLLYIYVNKTPNKEFDPLMREFLRMILSDTGQDVVEKDGYIRLPEDMMLDVRKKLSL